MRIEASSPEEYMSKLPEDRKEAIMKLRKEIISNLPAGFKEGMGYGMIGYVVPHSIFPKGYHCDPKLPLPFAGIASQKNFIAFYHMGIYADPKLLKWFTEAHAKASPKKLDMGKSCMRYKKPEDIPYALIGELVTKITPDDWIEMYERNYKNQRKTK